MGKISMKKVLIGICIIGSLVLPIGKMCRRTLAKQGKRHSSYTPIDKSLIKEEKPFVVVIPSYNNELYVQRNLESVFFQEYKNYRVIYIDDCSTDKTYEKASQIAEGISVKIQIIRNKTNKKALHNLFDVIHSLRDDEIVLLLDGDDWLSHTNVLRELNCYYNDPNVWLTYGQYVTYPDYEIGICREPIFKRYLKNGNLRKVGLFSRDTDSKR
jgi:cellulose synthase/poly-beta-1,6-N-acetylglucosamine synthase-like glycosyltransferase